MSRHIKHGKQWVCVTLFLITFLWVLLPESLSGPSVLWPSLLTLILAFMTRDIYFALLLGAFSGCLLLDHGNPFRAFIHFFDQHLIPVLAKPWNVSVILFSFFMGGIVELLNRNGSMLAVAQNLLGKDMSRRRAGLGAFAEDNVSASVFGQRQTEAVKIFDRAGWL